MIGDKAKENLNADPDRVEVIIYGAINILQTINAVLWVIILGWLTGTLYESIVLSTSASILRKYSGGGHASSPMRCAIIGAGISVSGGLLVNKFGVYADYRLILLCIVFSAIVSLIIIMKKAPVDSIEKPIDDENLKKIFRNKSIATIFVFLSISIMLLLIGQRYLEKFNIITLESIMLGILWQGFTLTKSGIYFINKVDKILKLISLR